jgi:hypothetical protein
MRRSHRAVHRIVWPVIGTLLLIGLVAALLVRPPPEKKSRIIFETFETRDYATSASKEFLLRRPA